LAFEWVPGPAVETLESFDPVFRELAAPVDDALIGDPNPEPDSVLPQAGWHECVSVRLYEGLQLSVGAIPLVSERVPQPAFEALESFHPVFRELTALVVSTLNYYP
jgi:hypothetical protein